MVVVVPSARNSICDSDPADVFTVKIGEDAVTIALVENIAPFETPVANLKSSVPPNTKVMGNRTAGHVF